MEVERKHTETGFSLPETMIAVALIGISAAAFCTTIYYATLGVRSIDTSVEVAGLIDHVHLALSTRKRCELNLAGSPVKASESSGLAATNPGAAPQDPFEVFLVDQAGARVPGSILQVGSSKDGLVVTSVKIAPGVEVEPGHRIGELLIEVSKGTVLGPSRVVRRLAMDMKVENEKLVTCSLVAEGDDRIVVEQICDISGDGSKRLNPQTGECEPVPTIWVPGNALRASCPSGSKLYQGGPWGNCKAEEPAGFQDPMAAVARQYQNGSTIKGGVSPFQSRSINDSTCECEYAVGISTNGWTCMAHCEDPTK